MNDKVHRFEEAGLGKAPFKFVGWFEGNLTPTPNFPIITYCQYCSTPIKGCFKIQSSDGKEFIVGCVCVYKTGDAGLMKVVNDEVAKQKSRKAYQRFLKSKEAYTEKEVAGILQDQPHPYLANLSMYDYIDYVIRNGHTTSTELRVATAVSKVLKTLGKSL